MDQPSFSSRAAVELLHAEVGYLLARAGIPVLHVKGPTVARWLYPDGGRSWGDVDVLLPPARLDEALAVLGAAGFVERYPGVNHHTREDHAVVVARPEGVVGGGEIDLHHRFPGITTDPTRPSPCCGAGGCPTSSPTFRSGSPTSTPARCWWC